MSKAKRILSLALAFIMVATGAGLSVFAKTTQTTNWDYTAYRSGVHTNESQYLDGVEKVRFTPEQGASYLLDLLDNMLSESMEEEMVIYIWNDEASMNKTFGSGARITLYLSNIDDIMYTIRHVVGLVNNNDDTLIKVKIAGSGMSGATAWLLETFDLGPLENLNDNGLADEIYRCSDGKRGRTGTPSSDLKVFTTLLYWLANQQVALGKILNGNTDLGLLGTILEAAEIDVMGTDLMSVLDNPGAFVESLAWNMLVNEDEETIPSGQTIDLGIQKVANWALITGTGITADAGSNSVLGENFEAILPYMANEPGGADLYGTVTFDADRDGDGRLDEKQYTMTFYQFVANAIDALMNSVVYDLLYDILLDAFECERTEEYPNGDPTVKVDPTGTGNLIAGIIIGLLSELGAETPVFNAEESEYVVPYVTKLLNWLINGGGLDTLIKIDYTGIEITDTMMSLLNDICRLLPGFFPMLGLNVDDSVCYTNDEMAAYADYIKDGKKIYEVFDKDTKECIDMYIAQEATNATPAVYKYLDDDTIVNTTDRNNEDTLGKYISESEISEKYIYETYGTGNDIIHQVYISVNNGDVKTNEYRYVSDNAVVNTSNENGQNYFNPSLIKKKHVLSNQQVYAGLIKAVLTAFVDDMYLPEYADSISAAGAYALASILMEYMPELNLFERLDAFYYNGDETHEGHSDALRADYPEMYKKYGKYVSLVDSSSVKPLAWTEIVSIEYMSQGANKTREIEIPRAAMDIASAMGAYFLNGWMDITPHNFTYLNDVNDPYSMVTAEQFIYEFILWGGTSFLPAFIGYKSDTDNLYGNLATLGEDGETIINGTLTGCWNSLVNSAIKEVYGETGYNSRTTVENPDYSKVWELLDKTIFRIIPQSWLPSETKSGMDLSKEGSWGLIMDWAINGIFKLDLQKIISILSINTDKNGDLNNAPIQVVINLLDRVLGIVLGGNAVLPHEGMSNPADIGYACHLEARHGLDASGNDIQLFSIPTRITSLSAQSGNNGLLNSANLTILISCLVADLYYFAPTLLISIGPLLLGSDAVPIAETKYYMGRNLTISDLEDYYEMFNNNGNIYVIDETNNVKELNSSKASLAESNCGATKTLKPGTSNTYIVTFPTKYTDRLSAIKATEYFSQGKVKTVTTEDETYYVVTETKDYLTASSVSSSEEDEGIVYNFSDFDKADFIKRSTVNNGEVSYEPGKVKYFDREDFAYNDVGNITYYQRYNEAKSALSNFIDDYKDTPAKLSDAYYKWIVYSIYTQMYAAGIYDSNGDGAFTSDDTLPSVPSNIYPYHSGDATTFDYESGLTRYDRTKQTTTVAMKSFSATNYETLNMAIELGKDNTNNIALPNEVQEMLVKFAINDVAFKFTYVKNTDDKYVFDWTVLNDAQKAAISAKCSEYGFTYIDNGLNSKITRPYFRMLSSSTNNEIGTSKFEISGIDTIVPSNVAVLGSDDASEIKRAIRSGYTDYITTLIDAKQGLYDYYDNIGWRAERAEAHRQSVIDTTIIKWLTSYVNKCVKGDTGKRNTNYVYDETGSRVSHQENNETIYETKVVYTVESYSAFIKAFDYCKSLINAGANREPGLTQSMVTEAYYGLMRAYRGLIRSGEPANWLDLDVYLAKAKRILNDGNNPLTDDQDNPVMEGGVQLNEVTDESWAALEGEYAYALSVRNAKPGDENYFGTIDDQDTVDNIYKNLVLAVEGLKYNTSVVSLKIVDNPGTNAENYTIITNPYSPIYRYIFLGKEGERLRSENFRLVGLSGSVEDAHPSTGGTGSYISGNYANTNTAYRYVAVIFGDINGDTMIDSSDATMLEAAMKNKVTLTESQKIAANAKLNTISPSSTYDELIGADFDETDIQTIRDYYMYRSIQTTEINGTLVRTDDPNYKWGCLNDN